MSFSWYFSKKIAFGKATKNSLSKLVIRIGQIAVSIGIIVSLITISTGVGARKSIKEKLADFNGHLTILEYGSNFGNSNKPLDKNQEFYPSLEENPAVEHIQVFSLKSGIIRTATAFEGIILKGMGPDFDRERFDKFMLKGTIPEFNSPGFNNDIIMPQKLADNLDLDVDSSFVTYFINQEKGRPIYRRFRIAGLYRTDIKNFDNLYLIGDIKHVQRLNQWSEDQISGFEVFTPDIENLAENTQLIHEAIGYQFYAESALEKFSHISNWVNLFDTNINLILGIMLLVVCINMILVLLILILERTRSIGLLKTFGASNSDIIKIFIHYGLFIMVPGILIGNLVALPLLLIQKHFNVLTLNPDNYYVSNIPVHLDWFFILAISLGSLLIAALVLILPALVIINISPAKTIRYN